MRQKIASQKRLILPFTDAPQNSITEPPVLFIGELKVTEAPYFNIYRCATK